MYQAGFGSKQGAYKLLNQALKFLAWSRDRGVARYWYPRRCCSS